ncbi:hypothetical protein [Pelosinus sp. sgz500959]|uniref:hypothetical protein n=1 Tax=Pelosinus sp. sgz500959 TaxID=3242472 RepID=UPI00366AA863
MLNERASDIEEGYKCSRCGGMFGSCGDYTVRCPFCSMICDEVKCRVVEMNHEEY